MGDVHDGGSLGVTFVKIDHWTKQQSILKTERKKCTALMLILCLRCAILGCVSGGARKIIKPGQKFKDSKFTLYIICK